MTGKEYAEIIDSFDVEIILNISLITGTLTVTFSPRMLPRNAAPPCLPVVALPCGISLHTISSPSGTL